MLLLQSLRLLSGGGNGWIPHHYSLLFTPLTRLLHASYTPLARLCQVVEMDGYHITIVEVRVTTA